MEVGTIAIDVAIALSLLILIDGKIVPRYPIYAATMYLLCRVMIGLSLSQSAGVLFFVLIAIHLAVSLFVHASMLKLLNDLGSVNKDE